MIKHLKKLYRLAAAIKEAPQVYYSNLLRQWINEELAKTYTHFFEKKHESGEVKRVFSINTLLGSGGAAQVVADLQQILESAHIKNSLGVSYLHYKAGGDSKNIVLIDKLKSGYWAALQRQAHNEGLLELVYPESFNLDQLPVFTQADILHLHNLHHDYFSLLALPRLTSQKAAVWTLHDEHSLTGHCFCSNIIDSNNAFEHCSKWLSGCGFCPKKVEMGINQDNSAFLWQLKKQVYAKSFFVATAPSRWLVSRLQASPLFAGKTIRYVPNGCDLEVFKLQDKAAARAALQLPSHKKIALFSADSGLMNPFKGGTFVYGLYERFKRKKDWLFLNLGSHNGNSKQTKDKEQNWMEAPYVADRLQLAQYYAAADVLLTPSLADNAPLVVIEAQACGLPVVAFATGGIPELIEHEKTGYVARYADSEDLARGLELWMEKIPNELKQISQAAAKRMANEFSLKRMASGYMNLYREILEEPQLLQTKQINNS